MNYLTPIFLTSYHGASGGAASSGFSFLILLIAGIVLYSLWKKGVFQSKAKFKMSSSLKLLIWGGAILAISLLSGNIPFAPIGFSLCFIGLRLHIKFSHDAKAGKPQENYYPSYWVAFSVLFTIFTSAVFLLFLILFSDDLEIYHVILIYLLGLFITYPIISLYFLPYRIAHKSNHKQVRAIYILNIFAGWTVIAWIIALIWAHTVPSESIHIHSTPNQSNADEIRKYKELYDSGVISLEEFEAKRNNY